MTIQEEIRKLAADRKAVILAHNYTRGEVQDVADYTGDSLELARKAATVDADVIGVGEMGIGNTTTSSAVLAVLLRRMRRRA